MNRFLTFLRQPTRSSRRATAAPPMEIAFDRWLDTQMPEPTSGVGEPSTTVRSDAQRAEFASLTETFRQVDRLDTSAIDAEASAMRQAQCWEDIMQATLAPTTPANPGFGPAARYVPPAVPRLTASGKAQPPTRTGGFARLSPVLNVAMAALLVVVLGLSAWSLMGTRFGGSGDPHEPTSVASLMALDPNATPSGSTVQGILPTADQCTIKPLTVDEVMARLDPWLTKYNGGGYTIPPWIPLIIVASPAAGNTDFDSAATIVAPITTATPVSAAPVDLAISDIAVVQREVTACFLAQDPFRIWAFIAPNATYWNFLAWMLMQRMGEQDVRAAIENLAGKTGPERMTMFTMQGYGIVNRMPLVNPDRAASAYGMDGTILVMRVSTLAYDVNHPDRLPIVQPIDQTYQTWLYVYDEASHRWLVDNIGDFGPIS